MIITSLRILISRTATKTIGSVDLVDPNSHGVDYDDYSASRMTNSKSVFTEVEVRSII